MEMFQQPVLLMALALVLAIGIERLLELIRVIEDYYEARNNTVNKWQRAAEKLRDTIEVQLESAKGADPGKFQKVLLFAYRYLSKASSGSSGTMTISTDQVRNLSIQMMCRFYGVVLGIFLASFFNIDLFALVNATIHEGDGFLIHLPAWLGIGISGIAMGFGADPVHKLITALERTRKNKN